MPLMVNSTALRDETSRPRNQDLVPADPAHSSVLTKVPVGDPRAVRLAVEGSTQRVMDGLVLAAAGFILAGPGRRLTAAVLGFLTPQVLPTGRLTGLTPELFISGVIRDLRVAESEISGKLRDKITAL